MNHDRKTTVMKKVCGEDVHEISPTVGFNIKSLEYKGYTLVGTSSFLFLNCLEISNNRIYGTSADKSPFEHIGGIILNPQTGLYGLWTLSINGDSKNARISFERY